MPRYLFNKYLTRYREPLINLIFVTPAEAGVQKLRKMDPGLRRDDVLIRGSLINIPGLQKWF